MDNHLHLSFGHNRSQFCNIPQMKKTWVSICDGAFFFRGFDRQDSTNYQGSTLLPLLPPVSTGSVISFSLARVPSKYALILIFAAVCTGSIMLAFQWCFMCVTVTWSFYFCFKSIFFKYVHKTQGWCPIKWHIFYLSIYISIRLLSVCWSSVDFSHPQSQTLPNDYDGKTVNIVCDHHLVVIAQPQRKLTP